ncbi:MAG: hypothetical protein K8S98_11415 [Planctomycetes bacterium]|nr:hypothetical protein [Planctomycetota bacterium]
MSAQPEASNARPSVRALGLLFLVALGLRLALLFVLDAPRAAESGDPWNWGHETACLAQSLVHGDFYGDPWNKGTGPSTWLTPPYPAFVALHLELFGGVSRATATALFVSQSVLSAATCLLLVAIGFAFARPRVGWVAGWLFAIYPPSLWHAVDTVWDTTAIAFGVALVVWIFLRAARRERVGVLGLAGLAFGALVFTNPAPASLAAAFGVYVLATWRDRASALRGLALFGFTALLVCLPWMIRNARVLGTPNLRANMGVEMRLGNNDTSTGRPVPFRYHPSHVAEELDLYRKLGEKAYGDDCMARATTWIAAHRAKFAELSLRRLQFFWVGDPPTFDARREGDLEARADWKAWVKFAAFGLAGAGALLALFLARLTRAERLFFGVALLLYGLPYFFTHVSERYRFPIDPLVLWLDAALLVRLAKKDDART